MPDSKHLVLNLVCPPGQFSIKTTWDKARIIHAINHPDDDGFCEVQGVDDTNDLVIVRWREGTTLFYTLMDFKKPNQVAVPRLVTGDKRVQ
jgi:hypothetical protein